MHVKLRKNYNEQTLCGQELLDKNNNDRYPYMLIWCPCNFPRIAPNAAPLPSFVSHNSQGCCDIKMLQFASFIAFLWPNFVNVIYRFANKKWCCNCTSYKTQSALLFLYPKYLFEIHSSRLLAIKITKRFSSITIRFTNSTVVEPQTNQILLFLIVGYLKNKIVNKKICNR